MNDTGKDDAALDRALAEALGPAAEDTAPLSRAVLGRMAAAAAPRRAPLAEVLADPRPAGALMLGALFLVGALGYAIVPGDLEEAVLMQVLVGSGF
jgi:hypothetical protein